MDESTDVTDIAQGAIFIRVVNRNFTIVEKVASIVAFKGTIPGFYLYISLKDTQVKCELNLNNVSVITTDGAPSTIVQKTVLILR